MASLDRSLIAGLSAFQDLTAKELDTIIGRARSKRIARNAFLFEEEQEAHSFFLLLDGHVRVVKSTPDGHEVTVRYISPGELMGIALALGRTTYPASAIAVVDCVSLAWPSHQWPTFAEEFPAFVANAYKTIGSRLQDAHSRVIEMSTEQVDQRVAHALLKLVDQTGKKTGEGFLIDFPLSRQNIAEMTGTTLHTVSRLLSCWEGKGLVKSGRQKVTVLAPHRLLELAEGRAEKS
ncbi:Crp/Fnr family transcriptional regulator [Mesorhizobium sp.]|uniref:Crp/Fnr family transcriptional regulator n=1 Tax=Mesorhizobium sp. TaxID=1871066 RepID=UPI000FEA0748|nr:Crp/Fnr family transcriptional regulator [Mesorhizobium sp.]RWM07712.1 MAG: Crp/Fnr family transcriptional regulator [Mesorhizobium sp.]RWM28578.1 MAG: Crp/Fnr family transcriptional regulator [Mesorhizobium sp.]RWM39458.1 MAG: Crp/Fnr family transcriptional regulator [Mesorhizobium sp.]TIO52836.1 MAG: Crp/Fnr family transcriptional regulator [Mesorhizobium sp.]TIO59549.1 MAG: Crp/Fnr family transcriptional regulator [Mesorhizobium sp.]